MAKRENQGLHIALIIFVFVTVIFMVTTVFFWKKASDTADELQGRKDALAQAQRDLGTADDENARLRHWIGYTDDVAIETIEQNYGVDMKTYGGLSPQQWQQYEEAGQELGDQYNYRALPERLMNALTSRGRELMAATDQLAQLEKDLEAARQQEAAAMQTAKEDIDALTRELAAERQEFNAEADRIRSEQQEQLAGFRQNLGELNERIVQKDSQISQLQEQVRRLTIINRETGKKLEGLQNPTFDVPDGQVVYVDQASRSVYVDVGRGAGVRPGMTFSVHPSGSSLSEEGLKGKIEVTKVMDHDTSVAKITDDSFGNPIMASDMILSPVWQPGTRLRFALAGFMDIDGDGRSDRDTIRHLILSNGGVIDAEVDDSGKRTGEISVNTRYLVLGEPPTRLSSVKVEDTASFSEIISEAASLSVQQISFERLLELMGYARGNRTVGLGSSARPEDFQPRSIQDLRKIPPGSATSELYR